MRAFIDIITEAFDKTLPIHWHDRSEEGVGLYHAEFQIDDGKYVVQFINKEYNPGVWDLTFVRNGELALSGTGKAVLVISTVMQAVREFITAKDPKHIHFSGNNAEGSRNRLYPKLLQIMQAEFPEYVSERTKQVGLKDKHTEYQVSRPTRPYVAPAPSPVAPADHYDDVSWEDLEELMKELEADDKKRKT